MSLPELSQSHGSAVSQSHGSALPSLYLPSCVPDQKQDFWLQKMYTEEYLALGPPIHFKVNPNYRSICDRYGWRPLQLWRAVFPAAGRA